MLSYLEPELSTDKYYDYFRTVGHALGAVRELDVQTAFISEAKYKIAGSTSRKGMALIANSLKKKRAKALRNTVSLLRKQKQRKIVRKLGKILAARAGRTWTGRH